MAEPLKVGVKVKEIATRDAIYRNCAVLHSDDISIVFEVHRNVTDDGGNVDNVVSQILLPWTSVQYVLVMEEVVS
jgi:hypothetical protein